MNKENILDISWKTILRILLAVIFLYFTYLLRDILVFFIFALIISILFNPAIDFFQKRKVPRALATMFIYVSILGLCSLLVFFVSPLFASEMKQFLDFFPQYFEKISPPLRGLGFQAFENMESFLVALGRTLEKMADNIFNVLFAIFGGIFATFFVVTVAIFLSIDEKVIERSLSLLFPKKYQVTVMDIWHKCQRKVAGWFGLRVLACLFVGISSFITFLLFNINYPFTLAILAGLLNFIPLVGPVLTGFLIFLIALLDSMVKAVFTLIVFILIQMVENNVLMPLLSRKFIGFPPVLVLLSLMVGAKLWGLVGAVLAVPLFGILFEFSKDFLKKRKAAEY